MSVREENIQIARGHLERFQKHPLGHLIGGSSVETGALFENRSPVNGESLGSVFSGTANHIDAAASAAADAFPDWVSASGKARRQLLHRVADLIVAREQEIAFVECMDTGQALRFMSKAALRGAENYRFFADLAPQANDGHSLPTQDHINYTTRKAIGPVGVITPWNTPFMLSTWKIAPALAAGCTVVHKPAEWSPLSARLLHEIMIEAGLPAGVVNLVNGFGETVGKALTEHPAIKAVAFVGESSTGSAIMQQGAETLKRVHFELGGKNPVVVFDDADIERAVDAAVFMIYSLNGERCTSSSRLLVQSTIYDAFTQKVAQRVKNLKVGHPLDPSTEVGPLIHPRHVQKVMSYMDIAEHDGATISVGGTRTANEGWYVNPTLFTNANNSMRIAQEEIFGPVLTAIPFSDEAEAIQIANDTQYGLAGYLWTTNTGRAHRVANQMDVGMVWVNSENNRHLPSPFGGTKASGIGRDGGDYSFDFYMETKNICVAFDTHKVPGLGK
jgi:5-carboxymethyl-2-hydroxymuconic-semialdehyde dehydrogenase